MWFTKESLGIIAGILSFAGYGLYIIATLRGQTKPNRATWWILTLVGLMVASSYYSEGARNTIWIPLSYVLGPLLVAILSLKYGERGWETLDFWCLGTAILSAILWYFFNTPSIVLYLNIAMDFVALLPTVKKSFLRPETEDTSAWAIEAVACFINIFAIERWTFGIVFYPAYLLLMNAAITALLVKGKRLPQTT